MIFYLKNQRVTYIFKLSILILMFILYPYHAFSDINKKIIEINANVIFLRHAIAPGFGDPEDFNLKDCETQRNLSEDGVKQSKTLGNFFKVHKIIFSEILSSEWCRCKDTLKEMDIGEWTTFSGLNSFFQGFSQKHEVLYKLNKKLLSIENQELVLMVTHQVVIYNITGISPTSGGIVLYNSKTGKSKQLIW